MSDALLAATNKTARRKLARLAKKERLKKEKDARKRLHEEKRKRIIEAKRKEREDRTAKDTQCWYCGSNDHQKTECELGSSARKTCFFCRKRGHTLADCPSKALGDDGKPKSFCFNCGEQDHTVKNCTEPQTPEAKFRFATCFVCNGVGHLSAQCPKSEQGIYPKGGCCKKCGSKMHLARDCPESRSDEVIKTEGDAEAEEAQQQIPATNAKDSGDSLEPAYDDGETPPSKTKRAKTTHGPNKKPAVVKF